MVIFKKRLKEKRKELGLTQEELGKSIYLSKGEVCAYEKGNRIPPLDVLIRIADFLEVDFLWLIGMEYQYNKRDNGIVNLSDDDIKIINALRRDSNLYEKFLDNPERVIAQISNNFIKNHN